MQFGFAMDPIVELCMVQKLGCPNNEIHIVLSPNNLRSWDHV